MALAEYRARLHRLFTRWDPRGVLVSDAQAALAVTRLRNPEHESAASLESARWVCDAAVHPVLEQPLPSAFRVSSFLPVTSLLSLAMISTKGVGATLFYHWLYQSHAAATRYCNYADTSRPLDARRMLGAYAASTGVAWGVSAASFALVARLPRLRILGLVVPHSAVACAGAISTVMNAEVELAEGIGVCDDAGVERGCSREAARVTVQRAVLLHGLLVPGCALLLPVVSMRTLAPHLMRTAPRMLLPTATALVLGGTCVVTPLAAACVPPTVTLPLDRLEPPLRALADADADDGRPALTHLHGTRPLY